MKEYEFAVGFFSTHGTFTVEAKTLREADKKAWDVIQKALAQLPVEVEYAVECLAEPDEDEELYSVVALVDKALDEYASDNVDVVLNEETNMLDIMYHSDNNSFAIYSEVADADIIDFGVLEDELDKRDVGHVW